MPIWGDANSVSVPTRAPFRSGVAEDVEPLVVADPVLREKAPTSANICIGILTSGRSSACAGPKPITVNKAKAKTVTFLVERFNLCISVLSPMNSFILVTCVVYSLWENGQHCETGDYFRQALFLFAFAGGCLAGRAFFAGRGFFGCRNFFGSGFFFGYRFFF